MRCFKCAQVIAELPEGNPVRQSERWRYTPAFVVEVIGGGPPGGGAERCAVVCWTCMHEIDPDMWMSDEGWDNFAPAVPFSKLPALDHDAEDCWDVEKYAGYQPPRDHGQART
jgi:hypothetical protein